LSVGIVIVTHGTTGQSLLEVAEFILGETMERVRFVPFRQSGDNVTTVAEVSAALAAADSGDGVLVLTDLIGASPANLVFDQLDGKDGLLVTGLNLAMLMRVWNYRDQPLASLAHKAVDGGRHAVKLFQK